jgi:Fe-S-cluster containining protein
VLLEGAAQKTVFIKTNAYIPSSPFSRLPDIRKDEPMPQEKNREKEATPRLYPNHLFRFRCFPGVACFTRCCQDITIVLTPYDLLRLKRRLQVPSDQFIEQHTIILPTEKNPIPMVILQMNEEDKRCPFVSQEGCSVYEDRPWACRMYPLDVNADGTYSLVTDVSRCLGLKEKDLWQISDWMADQEVPVYEEMNERLSEITAPLMAQDLSIDNPAIAKMVFMALYNLDKFRDFVFNSTFLDRFEVPRERVEKVRDDDVELLLLGIDWVKFGILGEKLFHVRLKENA